MEIADPALLSMKSYMILCTALAIRAFGVERASRIQFNTEWDVIYMLYHRELVERMQEKYPPGTRVEVVSLCNEEEHLKPRHERHGGGCG